MKRFWHGEKAQALDRVQGPGRVLQKNASTPKPDRHTRTPYEKHKADRGYPTVEPREKPGPWKGKRTPRSHCCLTVPSHTEHVVHHVHPQRQTAWKHNGRLPPSMFTIVVVEAETDGWLVTVSTETGQATLLRKPSPRDVHQARADEQHGLCPTLTVSS